MANNIVVTGPPQSGKSTLLEKILRKTDKCHGCLTREIRNDRYRIGFEMGNLIPHPEEEVFCEMEMIAHLNFDSDFRVSHYGVDVVTIDNLVGLISEHKPDKESELLRRELKFKTGKDTEPLVDKRFSKGTLLYLDEIGEIQLFSREFKKMAKSFLDHENTCIATLSSVHSCPFTDAVLRRSDVSLIQITENNRDESMELITELVSKMKS